MPAKKKTTKKTTEEVEPDPAFDAKSAVLADVGQQGDAEIQTIGAEGVGKIDDFFGDALSPFPDVPASSGIEQRLGELEFKLSNLRAGFDEFEELIAKVSSNQSASFLRLDDAQTESATEHHDRLLDLEMKVTRLIGAE